MVTQEQLRDHIGRRPFFPFRIRMKSGEAIDVTRVAQAVAMPHQMVVATPMERFRWLRLDQIDRVEPTEVQSGGDSNDSRRDSGSDSEGAV